jgi:DNA-binding LacI/PurR family transcriptional regulator
MKVTISDVAAKAGVSKTTVSRILNGIYDHTTEGTRNRVLQVIKDFDYRPNALAKGLKSSRTNVIGIVLSNLKNPFWSTVLEGVEDVCRASGFNLMICNSNEEPQMEEQYIREFQTRRVDGIVINPTVRNPILYRKLFEQKYPLVAINRRIPDICTHNVVVDNIEGASLAVHHLIKNGRKKIAVFVYKNLNVSTWQERVEGYRKAMLESGFTEKDLTIQETDQLFGSTKATTLRFLRDHPETEAIFSTNNMMTLEVIEAIKELKLRIPEDIAIVGYDETIWSKHLDPPLTTIMQPGYEMGKIAAQILIKTIVAKRKPKPGIIVLKPQLIIRKSCGSQDGKIDDERG